MTGQDLFDGDEHAGVRAAIALVNAVALEHAAGRRVAVADPFSHITGVLADDPPSVAALGVDDVPAFLALAGRLRAVFADLDSGDVDAAAARLNDLLADHPAQPHLAREDGRWRLHHHPIDAALVPMWTSICAEGLARAIGEGHADRLGTCAGGDCDRVFLDVSKNASRRFCSTACQNRTKAAGGGGGPGARAPPP
ncbi:MAG: CGNR zinc finger domain-containing protein, partial [Ilumatobacteraceae bacterium]